MAYTALFEEMGFLVDAVPDGGDALKYLEDNLPRIVVADETTPDFDAVDFLKRAGEIAPKTRVIIITPAPDVDGAVTLMKLGAVDYLMQPLDHQQLALSVKKALAMAPSSESPKAPAASPKAPAAVPKKTMGKKSLNIITNHPGITQLLSLAERVADSSASVLIQGESGTGKELFARFLHEKSGRSGMPFIAVNCAALPENLLESELFGHEKGAFTGAVSRKIGKFELADTGTLFLDEITEMQFHLQAKLLRVIQEKMVDRVGGTQAVAVDVRIIATTNRDAKAAVDQQTFREDLFYRLNTIPLIIPPLRDRGNDIALLSAYFIKKYCRIDGRNVKGLTPEAEAVLSGHPFPGNVRELENIIHRAVLLAQSDHITPQDLLMDADATVVVPDGFETSQGSTLNLSSGSLKEMEQKMIFKTLDQTEGNRTHAAKILGISVRTLRNKLNEYKAQTS